MKIPVDIYVRSERSFGDASPKDGEGHIEREEFRISGTMKNTKKGYQIEYSEDKGALITTVDTFGASVVINRVGAYNSHMVFSEDRAPLCICDTGFMQMQMRVRTKHLYNTLTLEGGKLDIDFTVEIAGNLAERNRLIMSVSPDKSIIRS